MGIRPGRLDQTLVLLDIDGVFNVNSFDAPVERVELPGVPNYPSPTFITPIAEIQAILTALDQADHLAPMWISSWGVNSHQWNDLYGTRRWQVVFPLEHYGLDLTDVDQAWGAMKEGREEGIYNALRAQAPDRREPLLSLIAELSQQPAFAAMQVWRNRWEEIGACKLMGAMVASHVWQGPVVWVEDGFQPQDEAWAKSRPQTTLFDTTVIDPPCLRGDVLAQLKQLLALK